MTKRILLAAAAVIGLLCSCTSKEASILMSKDNLGSVVMGESYTTVPETMAPLYTKAQSYYGDMTEVWEVMCLNEDQGAVRFLCDYEQDENLKYFILYTAGAKTQEGISLNSTAKEILAAGGEECTHETDPQLPADHYILLNGLYFYFDNTEAVEDGHIKADAKPYLVSNCQYPFFA